MMFISRTYDNQQGATAARRTTESQGVTWDYHQFRAFTTKNRHSWIIRKGDREGCLKLKCLLSARDGARGKAEYKDTPTMTNMVCF